MQLLEEPAVASWHAVHMCANFKRMDAAVVFVQQQFVCCLEPGTRLSIARAQMLTHPVPDSEWDRTSYGRIRSRI